LKTKASQPVGKGGAERALLVSVQLTGRGGSRGKQAELARKAAVLQPPNARAGLTEFSSADDFQEQTVEFRELARSAGATIAAEIVQRRDRADAATLIGPGKVEEVAALAAATDADVAIFGQDLSPSQLRNLEAELPCRVIDRTQLILDIFARHARTREGQLQVELAQLEYLLPRLSGHGKAMSQLGGGIGTRGPGETKLETDRRRIRRRIDQVRAQVEAVRLTRRQQRQRREAVPVPTVALVGYTNAGKSTLFNALTQAGVLESSRMFATLDPKLRAITLASRRRILLADTVGFVRQLPHTLVNAFRATLEEVETAEVLLHVCDASSANLERQKRDVETVLAELDVARTPRIEVLNKCDLLPEEEARALQASQREIAVSALKNVGLEPLLAAIEQAMHADPMQSARFHIPQSEGAVLAALEAGGEISEVKYDGNVVTLRADAPASLLGRYRRWQTKSRKK
jgi:GTP-binding protein HflX